MLRKRKHFHRLYLFYLISFFCQILQISCQCLRIAGNVHDLLRSHLHCRCHKFFITSGSRRIHKQHIHTISLCRHRLHKLPGISLEKSRRNKKKRTKVYYCHPYSSCERGSNENANRLIRRHIPKGVNFDKKSKTEIKEIETWINNYPRKIFEYDTAENQFINEMEKLTG